MTLYQKNIDETGRSLVEMLGVLAIIGVLSVGGIAGYTVAMNKHRANTLLDEASKRAIVVATQIAAGRFNAATALNEFGNNTINGITLSVQDNGDGTFSIKLSNMDNNGAICDQMENILGEDHINPTLEANCAGLKYNNDLGEGISGGGATCPEERKYTFRNVEMCCPHELSGPNHCANGTEDGCDSDMELGIDGQTCCDTDGMYQVDRRWVVDFSKCGCPDDMYYYDNDCHTCKKGECSDSSKTFVAGAIGTWDELSAMTNNGCPTGYHWADKSTTETYLDGILDGSLCNNWGVNGLGKQLWTSTEIDSDLAWGMNDSGDLADFERFYLFYALCKVE